MNFAIVQALATVSRSAAAPRSPVLALPLRVPKYTVTPMPRSRWYSIVSTSPSRALTLSPTSMLMAASAWLAPSTRASLQREFDQREQVGAVGGQRRGMVGSGGDSRAHRAAASMVGPLRPRRRF